jgi:hypothetical protein
LLGLFERGNIPRNAGSTLDLTGMTPSETCAERLRNQHLTGNPFPDVSAAVRALGAVQAQDYAGAKWALSLRTGATDAALDARFDEGGILRTHLMRTTWHFVDPADIRWMLALLAPRGRQATSSMNRKLGLEDKDFRRSRALLEKALRDRQYKTRPELAALLDRQGLEASGLRLAYLMMDAELEGLVVSGPRRGKQFTYALLDERAPASRPLEREEALAELLRRYFTGHGPAQAADLAWWSGLTLTEVKRGLASVGGELDKIETNGKIYWAGRAARSPRPGPSAARKGAEAPVVHLLPNYDEYFIAYKDHDSTFERLKNARRKPPAGLFALHILYVDGQLAGGWKRTVGKQEATVEVTAIDALSAAEKKGLAREVGRFGEFLGLKTRLVY